MFEYATNPRLDLLREGREDGGYAGIAQDMHREMLAYMKFYYREVSANRLAPPPVNLD